MRLTGLIVHGMAHVYRAQVAVTLWHSKKESTASSPGQRGEQVEDENQRSWAQQQSCTLRLKVRSVLSL